MPAGEVHTEKNAAGMAFSKGDFDAFVKQAQKAQKPYWVYFYADWCAPCKQLSATTFVDERVASMSNERFMVFKVDVEQFVGMDIAERYTVKEYPTILVFNAEGKLVNTLQGYYTPDLFMQKIVLGL
jgi:thiol:disulfide interchange protein